MDEKSRRFDVLLAIANPKCSKNPADWNIDGRPITPSELELWRSATQEERDSAIAMKLDAIHARVAVEIDEGLHDRLATLDADEDDD